MHHSIPPQMPLVIAEQEIHPGEDIEVRLKISQTYTGDTIAIPVRVLRASAPGPCVFVSAAIHGDEINGTGIIHDLLYESPLQLVRGTLILIPVVNVFGFESHERYLPDRRDLNRSFPGSESGSLAARTAYIFMHEIVRQCDFGIDLHSAAFQRTNFPNVRADWSSKAVRKLALAFGTPLIVDGKGPEGSLRREACKAGCPTIILEAGEPWKIEPSVLSLGVTGVRNVLAHLNMIDDLPEPPPYQVHIRKTTWIRSEISGIVRFHVSPGDIVRTGQAVATNYSILGRMHSTLLSPADGIILSVATLPAVKPGEPICMLALPTKSIASIEGQRKKCVHPLDRRILRDFSSSHATLPVATDA